MWCCKGNCKPIIIFIKWFFLDSICVLFCYLVYGVFVLQAYKHEQKKNPRSWNFVKNQRQFLWTKNPPPGLVPQHSQTFSKTKGNSFEQTILSPGQTCQKIFMQKIWKFSLKKTYFLEYKKVWVFFGGGEGGSLFFLTPKTLAHVLGGSRV